MLYEVEQKELDALKARGEAPDWYTVKSYITVSKGYRLKGETPKGMYTRVCTHAADSLGMPELAEDFFEAIWENFLCPASPVLSNTGRPDKGLPISCFGITIDDSIDSIMDKAGELATLTKNGGGVGVNFNYIRPQGTFIKGGLNGKTDGIIPFTKIFDSTTVGISQGSTRRGASSANLNIDHGDWSEFIRMRRPEGDINRQCGNIHHCSVITDDFMERAVVRGDDYEARLKWAELMKTRMETGESYIMFYDNVNKANPEAYKKNGLAVDFTNICSEITLFSDPMHSFICCLSSLNLANWERMKDWKSKRGYNAAQLGVYFLNGILNYFIEHASKIPGMEPAVRSAVKGRAIGLGVLGWHTLLQEKMLPFESFGSMQLNNEVFRWFGLEARAASRELAKEFGEPEWCKGTGYYNSHVTTIAPTKSNSIISGGVSAGIEPIDRNTYVDRTAKGNFYEKNPVLERLLETKGMNTKDVWKKINQARGSVQKLRGLSDEEKKVFLTAYELNQMALIRQAAQRQPYICQAQSLNLFFPQGTDPLYFNKCHILAWKLGIKTLYYCKSTSGIVADAVRREATIEDCESCSG